MAKPPEVTPDAPLVKSATDQLVDDWFVAHFHNRSPALDSEAYNVIYAAAQDLKTRLAIV